MSPTRSAGVLLPLPSLPGPAHCGDLGAGARRFVDWLADHGIGLWQLLPLHPTDAAFGYSPYAAQSVFAGDECYVAAAEIAETLTGSWDERAATAATEREVPSSPTATQQGIGRGESSGSETEDDHEPEARIDYAAAKRARAQALDGAFAGLGAVAKTRFAVWRERQGPWLDRYASWRALADREGSIHWPDWPTDVATPDPAAVDRVAFGQYVFAEQWRRLREYARSRGVQLFGDLPIYPQLDSADTWADRHLFKLGDDGLPTQVAGVPPDYFSADGQLWGNPVYDWQAMAAEGFAWWVARLTHAFEQYDLVRVDHFIGLVRAYEVPAHATTARAGAYADVPTEALFAALARRLPAAALIAEDLGAEHAAVALFMHRWRLPGMRVLQFGFGGDADAPHLPHNFPADTVAYTGTHDNNTVLGWYRDDLDAAGRQHLARYLGTRPAAQSVPAAALRLVLASAAALAVAPAQDILGLGSEARFNTPGTGSGNWVWRARPAVLYRPGPWAEFASLCEVYGRAPRRSAPSEAPPDADELPEALPA